MNHSDSARQGQGLIVLLGLLTAAAPLSIDMYIPGLPAISGEFGVDAAAAQRSLSSFFFGLAGGQLVLGPLSDDTVEKLAFCRRFGCAARTRTVIGWGACPRRSCRGLVIG